METCPVCGGSGWKIIEKDGISAAERCECVQRGRARTLGSKANIPPNYARADFENFILPRDNPVAAGGLSQAMLMARSYASEYPAVDKPGLLFFGGPGAGKTHLAVAVLRRLLSRGFEGVFFDFQDLLERIRAGWSDTAGATSKEAYSAALDTEILVLDDLGAHRMIDWVEDTVTAIITHRCNHRKPMIVTTNLLDPEAGQVRHMDTLLEQRIGMRARSRLFEMCRVVRMPNVEDYRIRTKKVMV